MGVSLKPLEIQLLIFVLNLHLITKVLDMSYKTRRILFFVTTIFVFENISQAKYLLVEIDGEPKVGGRSFDSRVSLDGLWPENLTTDAAGETADLKLSDILTRPLQTSDLTDDSDYPNEVPETPEKPPKIMKESLKSKSKPSKQNKKTAGARSLSLGGSSLESHPKRNLVNTKGCGFTRGFGMKIIGGEKASIKEFPWLVMIGPVQNDGTVEIYNCGGSLITKSMVLTAAHCLFVPPEQGDFQHDKLRVRIGIEERNQEGGFEEIDVIKMIPHETYIPGPEFKNDIALLKLERAYKDNKGKEFRANTICLPFDEKPKEKYLDMDVTVAGWGYTQVNQELGRGTEIAEQLQKLVMRVMEHDKCVQAHAGGSPVLEGNNLCAGGEEDKDSCGGDSGGPLMIEKKKANSPRKAWTQIGLVSWGFEVCATGSVPGVYTNVQHYLKWILDHL